MRAVVEGLLRSASSVGMVGWVASLQSGAQSMGCPEASAREVSSASTVIGPRDALKRIGDTYEIGLLPTSPSAFSFFAHNQGSEGF